MSATLRLLGHPLAGALLGVAVLLGLVWRLGTGPVLHGLGSVGALPLAAALLIGVPVTICCALRWSLVSRGLGVALSVPAAVAGCYRAQFLNTALPGGVLGDVNRAVRHGREAGAPGRAAGAVALERLAGQVVQLVLVAAVLLVVPSPVRAGFRSVAGCCWPWLPWSVACWRSRSLGGGAARPPGASPGRRRTPGPAGPAPLARDPADLAGGAGRLPADLPGRGPGRRRHRADRPAAAAGPDRAAAMAVPANVAGWGPREGAAAWAFGTAGLGADLGLATAVAYGVLAFVAALPGAAVLAGDPPAPRRSRAREEGAGHG